MTKIPEKGRRSIRLKGYDYSSVAAYFITICARKRIHLFGEITGGEMRLNGNGEIVQQVWEGLPIHYPHVELDGFVIMPNHIHAIIILSDHDLVGAGFKPAHSEIETNRAGLKPAHSEIETNRAGLKPAPTNMDEITNAKHVRAGLKSAHSEIEINRAGLKPAPTNMDEITNINFNSDIAPTKRHGLPEIVRALKTFSAKRINVRRQTPGVPVWQRNYYEHVIRNNKALDSIRQYIADNPAQWEYDRENMKRKSCGPSRSHIEPWEK